MFLDVSLIKRFLSGTEPFFIVEEVSMKWMDRPNLTEMDRGGVFEMDRPTKRQKKKN